MIGNDKKIPVVKDGVLSIVFIGLLARDVLDQKIILVKDKNDRGRGDNILMLGLPGGGIEYGEKPSEAIRRELFEETSLNGEIGSLSKFGCYTKYRPKEDVVNWNYLFITKVSGFCCRETNDQNEVSEICVYTIREIIEKAKNNMVHEGSIRLLIHFLNGKKFDHLNKPVKFGNEEF